MSRELNLELSDALQPLNENWRSLLLFVMPIKLPEPQVELMPKRQPIFLYDHNNAIYSPIIWIDQLLSQCTHLSCSVPAIRAMDKHILLLLQNCVHHHIRGPKDQLDQLEVS